MLCWVIFSDQQLFDKAFPMTLSERPDLPASIILAPTDPIYSLIRREGGGSGRDRRLDLFRYAPIPACGNHAAVAGPALGAPAAALVVERLSRSGARMIFLLSLCGSLTPDLRIGDLFIPTGGISEEGTSRLYQDGKIPPPDLSLTARIRKSCRTSGLKSLEGLIWTTDAPHRETPDKIASFIEQGTLAVDMEFTALSTLAQFHKLRFAALMVVSDEVYKGKMKIEFKNKEINQSLKLGAHIIMDILKQDFA